MLIEGKFRVVSADPCCKRCLRGECEYNVRGMCLNRGVCGKFTPTGKEAGDGE